MFKNLEIAKEVVAGMDQQVADIQAKIASIQAGDELLENMPEQVKQLNDALAVMANVSKYLYLASDSVKSKFPDVVTAAKDKVDALIASAETTTDDTTTSDDTTTDDTTTN